ncbi:MAG: hypothetical protein U5J78_06630, partial [Parasphingorhabdus sp.]|nr:hypothetical protein [Parasphingorhabdus sp.]
LLMLFVRCVLLIPEMAIDAGILHGTQIAVRPLTSDTAFRQIALVWRRNSPREEEFRLLASIMRDAKSWVNKG